MSESLIDKHALQAAAKTLRGYPVDPEAAEGIDEYIIKSYLQACPKSLMEWESGWISTKDRLPEKPGKSSYEHVECLIVYKGEVLVRPWNCEHLCWDREDGDDWFCNPTDAECWMPLPHARMKRECSASVVPSRKRQLGLY